MVDEIDSYVSQTILNMFFISVLSASSDCAIESSACFDERPGDRRRDRWRGDRRWRRDGARAG